jgi:SAM-dependent methyltransferase
MKPPGSTSVAERVVRSFKLRRFVAQPGWAAESSCREWTWFRCSIRFGPALTPSVWWQSAERWETAERFDLVTCVHGLHYIGDKLGLLRRASGWLRDGGLVMAHLDYRNLRINGRRSSGGQIGKDLRRIGVRFVSGKHLLIGGTKTPAHVLPLSVLGCG